MEISKIDSCVDHDQMPDTAKTLNHKLAYSAPVLIHYGSVNTLTQGSGGTRVDGNGSRTQNAPTSSDPMLKHNVVRVGDHPLGVGLYLFDYKPEYRDICGHGRQFGVMADEVELVLPEAVTMHPDGYRTVDYAALGIHRIIH